jgi:hypothetical protein
VSKDRALDVTKGANMPVLNKGKAIVETPVEARAGFLNRPVLWVLVSGGAICFDLLGLLHRLIGLGGPPAIGAALLLMDCLVWDPTVLGCRWAEVGPMGSHRNGRTASSPHRQLLSHSISSCFSTGRDGVIHALDTVGGVYA